MPFQRAGDADIARRAVAGTRRKNFGVPHIYHAGTRGREAVTFFFEGMGFRTMTENKMKATKPTNGEVPCLALARKREQVSAKIRAPELDPQVATDLRFRAIVDSVLVHASKEAQALAIIEESEAAILDALRRGNYATLAQLLDRFDQKFRFAGLTTPKVEPTERERCQPVFLKVGWDGQDSDAAFMYVRSGERIESIEFDHFVVAGRRIERERVRLGLKPRFSKLSDAEWLGKFPPMRRGKLMNGDMVFE
jgi:hypothetical protein